MVGPIVLDGKNLGEKHKQLNHLVKKTIDEKILFEDIYKAQTHSDIDALFKIDVASKSKNVEYILDVLKSDDMLMISRAIKQSIWLIKDENYKHLINPLYLETTLLPDMMPKAVCKLLLTIRLNLNDENRVEEFYKYYENKDVYIALKWLPKCSVTTIIEAVKIHRDFIKEEDFKKLCERSALVLKTYYDAETNRANSNFLPEVKFFMRTDPGLFLDIYEKYNFGRSFKFGLRTTEELMKNHKDRVVSKFEKYAHNIHMNTFAKFIKTDEVTEFLTKQSQNEKLRYWFKKDNLEALIKMIPQSKEKLEFLTKLFAENKPVMHKTYDGMHGFDGSLVYCCLAVPMKIKGKASQAYKLYGHAPFDISFLEIQKLIKAESAFEERADMLVQMITCAGHNENNLKRLLNYFLDKHINEAAKLKLKFVNNLVIKTKTQNYSDELWKLLQEIFYSLEVYNTAPANNVSQLIECIVIYHLVRDEDIPEVIESKFVYSSLTRFKKHLDKKQRDKVFQYLYQYLLKKINSLNPRLEKDYESATSLVTDITRLIVDWNQNLRNYPGVIEKMKELIKVGKELNRHISFAYHIKNRKEWRKYFFEESIQLWSTEESCLNALKHDPGLLKRYESEVDAIKKDSVAYEPLLRKLRTYYFNSALYNDWLAAYQERLKEAGEQSASVKGIFMLVPKNDLLKLIKENIPKEKKICWSEMNEVQLGLQKNIAKNMHLIRPQISLDIVLPYLQGDYVPFANPSLSALFYNQPSNEFRKYLETLLKNGNKSVEKQGIRAAFIKLNVQELKEIFTKVWQQIKNLSIRAVVFHLTFKMMCDCKSPDKATEIWTLLKSFIDDLSTDKSENTSVYEILEKVDFVPKNLKPVFLMRSYDYFKGLSLSNKSDYMKHINKLRDYTEHIMECMDPDFMTSIIQEHIEELFVKGEIEKNDHDDYNNISMIDVIVAFILCAQTEEDQQKRHDSIFLPILNHLMKQWNVVKNKDYFARRYFKLFLQAFLRKMQIYIRMDNIITPVKLFMQIKMDLEERLKTTANYTTLTLWSIAPEIVKLLHKAKSMKDKDDKVENETEDKYYSNLILKITPEIVDLFAKTIEDHHERFFPTVTQLLPGILSDVIQQFKMYTVTTDLLKIMLDANLDKTYTCIVVINMMLRYCDSEKNREKIKQMHQLLSEHPSMEVQTHYYARYSENHSELLQ